jgi:hypothetical protein
MGDHHGLSLGSLPSWWAVVAFLLLLAASFIGSFEKDDSKREPLVMP